MSYLSLSTWSLHRLLGPLRWTVWDPESGQHLLKIQEQPEVHPLLQLPAEAANRGYAAIEVCHFHFPSTEPHYLKQLKEAFRDSGVSLDTLLLDYGDLTTNDPKRLAADLAFMRSWIDAASLCGAKQIRIVAGEAEPSDENALRRAAQHLKALSEYARPKNVTVVTENFKALTSTGESCRALMEQTGDEVRWITDFGNFNGVRKYEELGTTLPRSVSVHAKAHYDERGMPDQAEFEKCLDVVTSAGFDNAYVLIYDGPGDMWEGLERIRVIVDKRIRKAI